MGTGTSCTCLRNDIPVHPHQQKTRRLFFKGTAVSACQRAPDFTRCAQVEAASSWGCLKKKKAPSSQMVLFWSGRRGSNSLPGIPRMAMAIRGSPASPRMISRAARRSRQRVLGAVCKKKKAPSSQMVLFWSGRRGSNSLPGIPRMAMAIRGSPASPRMISRAARRSRQRVLGAVCKKKKAPSSQMVLFWSGRRGSNSLPRPWQGRALPDELRPQTQDRL